MNTRNPIAKAFASTEVKRHQVHVDKRKQPPKHKGKEFDDG